MIDDGLLAWRVAVAVAAVSSVQQQLRAEEARLLFPSSFSHSAFSFLLRAVWLSSIFRGCLCLCFSAQRLSAGFIVLSFRFRPRPARPCIVCVL